VEVGTGSQDGVAPSQMVSVSASVNLPLHHKVQKFSSGTGSPGWSRKKVHKTVVVVVCINLANLTKFQNTYWLFLTEPQLSHFKKNTTKEHVINRCQMFYAKYPSITEKLPFYQGIFLLALHCTWSVTCKIYTVYFNSCLSTLRTIKNGANLF